MSTHTLMQPAPDGSGFRLAVCGWNAAERRFSLEVWRARAPHGREFLLDTAVARRPPGALTRLYSSAEDAGGAPAQLDELAQAGARAGLAMPARVLRELQADRLTGSARRLVVYDARGEIDLELVRGESRH